ncbi:GNAT family N-acetyltransferase [Dyella monticola]|nr:GNAT family N-acetyltransferase [Dyella monticola]
MSQALRRELVALWMREGVLPSADEAWRRSWEAACLLHEGDAIAGVCTVAIRMDDYGKSYGFVRIFIRPSSRMRGLGTRMMEHMIEGFTALAQEPGAPQRLIVTVENRKLERRAGQRLLAGLGFVRVGTAANGEWIMERGLAA